jgi:sugar phosphate isomerase/epimerase
MNANSRPFLLTGYGVPYSMGYIPLKDGSANPSPMSAVELARRAAGLGLAGIEIPLATRVPSFEGRVVDLPLDLDELGWVLREEKLSVVADYGVVDSDAGQLREYLYAANRVGVTVVRATLSNILCGDRRTCPGGWAARLEAVAERLREVLPCAGDLGMTIAVENHQDASTDDLLRLADMVSGHAAFGVTFDTGNPLAVAEDPVESARRLAPLIRHVHLKDYTMHFAPDGYRLSRCAAGDGVIDFPAILDIVRRNSRTVIPGIEIAAQATRTIPILDRDWWSTYPPRAAAELIEPLRILFAKGRSAEASYLSGWERGLIGEQVIAEEWMALERSIRYFRHIARRV